MKLPATQRDLLHAALYLATALLLCAGTTLGLARSAYADDEERKAKEAELALTAEQIRSMPAGPARQDAEAAFRNTVEQARLDYGIKTPLEYTFDQAKEKYERLDAEWTSKYVNLPQDDPTRNKFFFEQWIPASREFHDLELPASVARADRGGTLIDPDLPAKRVEQGEKEYDEKKAKEEAEEAAKEKAQNTLDENIGVLLPEKPPPPKDPEDADGKSDGTFLENVGLAPPDKSPSDNSSQSAQPPTTGSQVAPIAGPQVAPVGPVKPPESVAPPPPLEDSMAPPDPPMAPTKLSTAATDCASIVGLGLTFDQCAKILTGDVTNPDQQISTCLNEAAVVAGIGFGNALELCKNLLSPKEDVHANQPAPNEPVLAGGTTESCPTLGWPAPVRGLLGALWLDTCPEEPSANAGPQVIMVESTPADAPMAGPTTNPVEEDEDDEDDEEDEDEDEDDDDDDHTNKSNKGKDGGKKDKDKHDKGKDKHPPSHPGCTC